MTLRSNRFDLEPELTAKFARLGLRIWEVPVTFQPRTPRDGKKIHWMDGFHAIWILFWNRLRKP